VTDHNTTQRQECLMYVGSSFITNTQPAKLMQPALRSLDNPAIDAKAASVLGSSTGQNRLDAALAKLVPMRLRIVSSIALDTFRTTTWSARLSGNGRNRVHQREQLGHVMTVGRGDRRREGDAVCVRDDVMFGAFFAAIRGIGARFRPPKAARTDALSTTARDQSILSASWSRSSRTLWILSQTPRRCQSRSRRQQVIPHPQPISCGRYSQPIPVLSTKMTPVRTDRLSLGLRPGNRRRRRFGGGSIGSIIFHSSSSKTSLAMAGPPCPSTKSVIMLTGEQSFC